MQYGINSEDAVQHPGCIAVRGPFKGKNIDRYIADRVPELRCPCGARNRKNIAPSGQLVRDALRPYSPTRHVTYGLALDILRLIDRCQSVLDWRAERGHANGRDAWSAAYGRVTFYFARSAGLIAAGNAAYRESQADLQAEALVELNTAISSERRAELLKIANEPIRDRWVVKQATLEEMLAADEQYSA